MFILIKLRTQTDKHQRDLLQNIMINRLLNFDIRFIFIIP